MAKVITTELQHSGASGANITLDSSKNVTVENNLTVDGTTTLTGAVTLPAGTTSDTLSFRNLIINGAMQVAQRGTSSTTTGTYVADRWKHSFSGHDEAPTIAIHALTSSDTGPWGAGFKKCLQLTNGNQTSGAGAADFFNLMYYFEGQDVANSGWDYKDPNSKITLSFWMKSSVAQNFHGYVRTPDGTAYSYPFETGSLSADDWTKITKTIPGNANLQIDNDNGAGFQLVLYAFGGTDYTATPTLNTWAAYSGSTRTPDQTSTWWTTNDSDIELTGFQLETGSTATDFEHRSYGDELARCQRYYYRINPDANDDILTGTAWTPFQNQAQGIVEFPVTMRARVTALEQSGTATDYQVSYGSGGADCSSVPVFNNGGRNGCGQTFTVSGTPWTVGDAVRPSNKTTDGFLAWSAEL